MCIRDRIYPIEPEEDRVVGLAVQRPTAMAPAVEQMFHHIVEFVDIAGLVKGASQGAGLGNKFLGHIREMCIRDRGSASGLMP